MNYQTILFDADGVLIKSQYRFSDRLQEIYGTPVERLQPFFSGVFRDCTVGKASLKEELGKVIGEWGWKGTVDELLAFWFSQGTEIDPEVAEFVRELRAKGIKTYMTSDQTRERGEHLRATLGHGVLFDECFFSGEIGCSKKEPGFFPVVDARVGGDRSAVLFVDDDPKNVEVAKAFGYAGYLFKNLDGFKQFLSE